MASLSDFLLIASNSSSIFEPEERAFVLAAWGNRWDHTWQHRGGRELKPKDESVSQVLANAEKTVVTCESGSV